MSIGLITAAADIPAKPVPRPAPIPAKKVTRIINKNLDIRNGLLMMVSVLIFTVVGSYAASLLPSSTMGSFSVFMTFILGVKFIVRPVMTTKEAMNNVSSKKRAIQSIICGTCIGFICGFVGAGGGMMMLLILTSHGI